MIEDKELRNIFKIECDERIQNIEKNLLLLEKNPNDLENLQDISREVHSLKGAARMVCLNDVETTAHHMESILEKIKSGEIVVTPEKIDLIYLGLDSMRALVHEAVTGEPSGIDVLSIISHFNDKEMAVAPGNVEERPNSKDESLVQEYEMRGLNSLPENYHIDAIRVETSKLDTLMTYASELMVSKTNIVRQLANIDEIIDMWDELNKHTYKNILLFREIERGHISKSLDKLINFHKTQRKYLERIEKLLRDERSRSYEDNERLDYIVNEFGEKISNIRLLPLSTLFNLFPRTVRDISRDKLKEVQLLIKGGETTADKRIIEEMKDPLTHIIRNAIDHGVEIPHEREKLGKTRLATITMRAFRTAANIVIEVKDDGKGLDIESIKRTALKKKVTSEEAINRMSSTEIQSLIFESGFSTTEIVTDVSGRGIGLDVVRTNIERLKGVVSVKSSSGAGTTFSIQLPTTLVTTRVLIVSEYDRIFALPMEYVQTNRFVSQKDILSIERQKSIIHDDKLVSISYLSEILELNGTRNRDLKSKELPCIILSTGHDQFGIVVDELLDERVVVLKPHGAILKRVRNVLGTTILGTGEVCVVLNPSDLEKTMKKYTLQFSAQRGITDNEEQGKRKSILLVEDSISTRTQEKRILESASYEVVVAVDGVDAWNKLNSRTFHAIVSDIQMPNMDGWALTEKIRKDKKYKELPVILVTALSSDEDRKKGIELGANAYINKPTFDQTTFLDILKRLI
jgi:two-component system, chemotaxis family, sensor kinase CheA